MDSEDSRRGTEDFTRIFLRPLASPIPLGFFAFGVGSFVQSGLQLGWIPQSEGQSLAIIIGAFVAPAELLAAIVAFLTRETLGATVLGLFSFVWLSTSLVLLFGMGMSSGALGLLDLYLAAVLVLLGVSALLGKPVLAVVIMLAAVRFALNGAFELSGSTTVQVISGAFGITIAAISLYGGLAFGIEDVQHRTVLPLGRRGEAAEAFEGDLSEQVGPVEQEAGVRKQL